MAPVRRVSQSPSAEAFVQLVDKLRKRGAVRVTWGPYACDFSTPEHDEKARPIQPLGEDERRRLDELEERYGRDEELGNV